ncbi:MAG TPA: succinylglutamate desuccinylase/aspartoacylase family protein [Saprospiraceae bacterium]|nr:succinylglutamate desuccinylase/aspartoacylase family protein [Saprospiraceae bacterium]
MTSLREIRHINTLNLDDFEKGKLHKVWFDIVTDAFGMPISLPVLIGRGREDGPVLGLTAAVHGNELNGIPVIQRLFKEIENEKIRGTVIGVPVVNAPAFFSMRRQFLEEIDLNHIMPGKKSGNVSEVYSYRFTHHILSKFNYLLDLHTASFGRINSYYIRANMKDPVTTDLAMLQNAQIIVHNEPSDGTLRGAANALGIPAITLEVGNPGTFQKGLIRSGITGLLNAMIYLEMFEGDIELPDQKASICKDSFWIYTEKGGLLNVHPGLAQMVEKGELIATQYNIFGDKIIEYFSPEKGIVIGKSTNPVNQTGGRILHLGIINQ